MVLNTSKKLPALNYPIVRDVRRRLRQTWIQSQVNLLRYSGAPVTQFPKKRKLVWSL